ncbi:hypothetical protein M0811_04763 [Anaeramoeba ignava]|uniref:Importin N-terminal domain-containing protein n=1 Tax=Anaeramoeba ignava TaxID=1746090 RepID=A0A9Q0LSZ6_ANAIG|nr:hypothetical protein M0811_04763 [Anaeramoeba ignava]
MEKLEIFILKFKKFPIYLSKILNSNNYNLNTRILAGITLKNKYKIEEIKEENFKQIQENLLQSLSSENNQIRRTTSNIISTFIRNYAFDLKKKDDKVEFLFNSLFSQFDSFPSSKNLGILQTILNICQDNCYHQFWNQNQIEFLSQKLSSFFQNDDILYSFYALSSINQLIFNGDLIINDSGFIIELLKLSQKNDISLLNQVCWFFQICLNDNFVKSQEKQMNQIIEFMIENTVNESDQISIICLEYWTIFFNITKAKELLDPYLPKLVRAILFKLENQNLNENSNENSNEMMIENQDIFSYQNIDDFEMESIPRQTAQLALDSLSRIFGKALFLHLEDLLSERILSGNIKYQEVALFVFGIISENCKECISSDLIYILKNYFFQQTTIQNPFIKKTICWIIEKYSDLIIDQSKDFFDSVIFPFILDCCADNSNQIAIHIASHSTLISIINFLIAIFNVKQKEQIIQMFIKCFGIYSNVPEMLVLYDSINGFIENTLDLISEKNEFSKLVQIIYTNFINSNLDNFDLQLILETLNTISRHFKYDFESLSISIIQKCIFIIEGISENIKQKKTESIQENYLVSFSFELISEILEHNPMLIYEVLEEVKKTIYNSLKIKQTDILQSVSQIIGNIATFSSDFFIDQLEQIVSFLITNLNLETTLDSVCNNSIWALNNFLVNGYYSQKTNLFFDLISENFFRILVSKDEIESLLLKNCSKGIAILGIFQPQKILEFFNQKNGTFSKWLICLNNLIENEENNLIIYQGISKIIEIEMKPFLKEKELMEKIIENLPENIEEKMILIFEEFINKINQN